MQRHHLAVLTPTLSTSRGQGRPMMNARTKATSSSITPSPTVQITPMRLVRG